MSNNDKKEQKKYYINWAITLNETFNYGGIPLCDETVYHGLNLIFKSDNIDNMIFFGPISTTLERNQADIFSSGTGVIWDIKQQTYKPLSFIYGIKLNKIGISKFPTEQEVLFYNTKIPIIHSTVHNININDKNKLIIFI